MYISRESNFHDLSKIAQLNTREFLQLYCAYCASAYFIFTWLFGHFGRKVDY